MIILDAQTVGGRLMLVDMAGSENIEQAGHVGLEAKMQESFKDNKSKMLMILCASPELKETTHKTISTLKYGAKEKCIVSGPHAPVKDKINGNDLLLLYYRIQNNKN
ncbi:kinesin-like protein KIN-10A [Spinacia oleracea]|uniref:Kinesin-like protein KIN-10A n=1 Tax=Spinacia oleracea TaxID=3562 RepID=A0ABM3R505_SPIOL|nr:kinesin-like protein KIN-10A [Spinacia oleracea]